MQQVLQRAWLRRGALAWLLWPVSLLFGALSALRRGAYGTGLLASEGLPVPVIVVGSVLAGGSGKTPLVLALVEHLRLRGLAPGVVSRGYGRTLSDCREVRATGDPRETGDEPLLIAQVSRVPVFVAPRRADAAKALLAAYPRTRVIVCDDGLQHYRLRRDIEICVFDERGIGNGWLLPAGPLREHWPRRADLVACAGSPPGVAGFQIERRLSAQARRGDGARTPLAALRGRPLAAVAAIARPEAFFAMLREAGLHLERAIALPDHYDFSGGLRLPRGELICTHKDAVKLWRTHPHAWAVSLELDVAAEFWTSLDALLDAKLSSGDGPQTA